MKKTVFFKRVSAIIMVLCLGVTSMITAGATWDDEDVWPPEPKDEVYTSQDGSFEYKLMERGTDLTAYISKFIDESANSVEIPSEIDGHRVDVIGNNAFENNTKLTSVKTTSDILIYTNAFTNCKALKTFIAENFVLLETKAFNGCSALGSVSINKTGVIYNNAFYSCKNLKEASVSSDINLYNDSIGFYDKNKKVDNFVMKITLDKEKFGANDQALYYCSYNGFKSKVMMTKKDFTSDNYNIHCGIETALKYNGKTLKTWKSSDNSVIKLTKNGKLTALKKGTAKISVKVGKNTYTRVFKVTKNPGFSIRKDYKIKKGSKSQTFDIIGKAPSIKNIYTNDKNGVAKIVEKASGNKIVIKGLKKGTATLKIKVNNWKTFKFTIKVV